MSDLLLYIASGMTTVWGVAHLSATRSVVREFGTLSTDNRRILTMEWIVEGIALLSISAFVLMATLMEPRASNSSRVFGVAIVSFFTGFRVSFLPYRLCPFIFTSAALLIGLGAWAV